MRHLQSLTLYRGLIEDEGIQRLTDMASLQRLEIHEAGGLTDRSLSLLASLRELRELQLSDTRMTATTLPELAATPSLTKIEIFGRPIDPKVIDEFYSLNGRCQLATSFETVDSHSRSFVSAPPLH
jgi:hypothetical protein